MRLKGKGHYLTPPRSVYLLKNADALQAADYATVEVTQLRVRLEDRLGEITIEGTDNGLTEVCLHFSLALPAVWETCDTYLKIQPRNSWSRERSAALGPEFLENGNCSVHVTPKHSKAPDTSTKYVLNVPPNRYILP